MTRRPLGEGDLDVRDSSAEQDEGEGRVLGHHGDTGRHGDGAGPGRGEGVQCGAEDEVTVTSR